MIKTFQTLVIGGGHASCEAALASARIGVNTALVTINLDLVAEMPCNPAIGGSAKGQLVNEIDALGGQMGINCDKSLIQIRWLNTGKGPAIQSLRAQCDRFLYRQEMKKTLESQSNLSLYQSLVTDILLPDQGHEAGFFTVKTLQGVDFRCECLIIGTGTFLNGTVHYGDFKQASGRSSEVNSESLAQSLIEMGIEMGRLKTGTPARLAADSIDTTNFEKIPCEDRGLKFSAFTDIPVKDPAEFVDCFICETNEKTHEIIAANFENSPLFSGKIGGIGPRYCPSIEDKVFKFSQKKSHRFFLEPELSEGGELYVQGMSSSLPEEVQWHFLRTIPGFEKAVLVKPGYAITYDFVLPHQLTTSLELKKLPGMFLVGQINGTSGYEEAAAQGLIAGVNAAHKILGRPPFIPSRNTSYIGVMIDDLTTMDIIEPYRMLSSRAENRLYLRTDNAPRRLFSDGYRLGLINEDRWCRFKEFEATLKGEINRLKSTPLAHLAKVNKILKEHKYSPVSGGRPRALSFLLTRPEMNYATLKSLFPTLYTAAADLEKPVEIEIKYEGYIQRQKVILERNRVFEKMAIPRNFSYDDVIALSFEAREKLKRFLPENLAQAKKIAALTASDLQLLIVKIRSSLKKTSP